MCVVLIIIGEKWFLNSLYQYLYSVLLNIIGVSFSTLPVNRYIKHSSLWIFAITPKYYRILFKKIKIHKPFSFDVFQSISVHSLKHQSVGNSTLGRDDKSRLGSPSLWCRTHTGASRGTEFWSTRLVSSSWSGKTAPGSTSSGKRA